MDRIVDTNMGKVATSPSKLNDGRWSELITYKRYEMTLYGHDSWVSKKDDNVGHTPAEGSEWWFRATNGGQAAYDEGESARIKGNAAEAQGNAAAQKATLADTAAQNADTAAANANEKAQLANTKATLADEKATLADTAAHTADTAAQNANDKATLANTKAELADEKATLADTKAQYAQTQGDYAKAQGDYAKAWNDHPPYIGTEDNFWYIWDSLNEVYVKSAYAKGDDLHWEEMTEQEKEDLSERVLAELVFAADEVCEDIIDELT